MKLGPPRKYTPTSKQIKPECIILRLAGPNVVNVIIDEVANNVLILQAWIDRSGHLIDCLLHRSTFCSSLFVWRRVRRLKVISFGF